MRKGICYFGSYDPQYSRNRIIKKGLKANKIKVIECQAQGLIFKRYRILTKCFLKNRNNFGSILVGFPGHYDVVLAFLLGKIFKKKVFFDIFTATYETYVLDRKVVKAGSFEGKLFFFLDWLALRLSDYVIADTRAHADFYRNLYKLRKNKLIIVYLGSDTDIFYPRKVKNSTDVLFYGSFQPLQGADIIAKVASLHPDTKFKMIGSGQTRKSVEALVEKLTLKNIEFINWLPLIKLAKEIAKAKIVLGIFGTTEKAKVVIPNKIYDAMACQKPIITLKTPAAMEILRDGKNCLLVSNFSQLSKAVKIFIKNTKFRRKIAKEAYLTLSKSLTPNIVVKELINHL